MSYARKRMIAVLGWGSLVWSPGELCLRSSWSRGGPSLPIEFSRISGKGHLTLVIDTTNGAPTMTRFATSCFDTIDPAVINLRDRERTTLENIGYVDLVTGRGCTRCVDLGAVGVWAENHRFNAVIWTDLESNFEARRGEPFQVDAAIVHLRSLEAEESTVAFTYIKNSPVEVSTPVRRAASSEWPDLGLAGIED